MKYETAVKDILKRSHDVKSFRFPRPSELVYKPGQFLMITIKDGQGEITKHFSISSSPTETDFIEFTKKLTGNKFSNALDALQIGAWARIDAPYGAFTFQGEYAKLAMITGGIGITSARSIIKYCTDMKLNTDVVLLYSNHTTNDICFKDELDTMQSENKKLRVIYTITDPDNSWTGIKGRINVDLVKKEIPDYAERLFYISGPVAMVQDMVTLLKGMGIAQAQIKQDLFTGFQPGPSHVDLKK